MEAIKNALSNVCEALRLTRQLLRYAALFFWGLLCPKAVLAARLLAAESQLARCRERIEQRKDPRPRLTPAFRLLWVVLSKALGAWENLAQVMQPATVKNWHTAAFRLWWRYKSRAGRPPVSKEMQALIRQLNKDNVLWAAEHIRETLVLLGYNPPCEDTIRKYMVKRRKPRKPSTSWLPFLRNHLDVSWAIDFFTVTTIGFRNLYVFLVLEHGRRRVVHFATSYAPSMIWVVQQLRDATPYGQQPRYLSRHNDGIYGNGVTAFLRRSGSEEVRTAYRSPWQNPYVERFVGALRWELLDHVIVLNRQHLEREPPEKPYLTDDGPSRRR